MKGGKNVTINRTRNRNFQINDKRTEQHSNRKHPRYKQAYGKISCLLGN